MPLDFIEIPIACISDKAFSETLEAGDGCEYCEFLTKDDVYCIGGQLFGRMGVKNRCEKGYWKEDV